MEANYVHKDSTTLIQDELVKNELNQIELQYNALKQQKFNELLKENKKLKEKVKKLSQWDINKDTRNSRQRVANAKLLKENQELKLELSGYRQAILNNKEMLGLKEQNEKLKKKYENAVADYETTMSELQKLKKQLESANEQISYLRRSIERKEETIIELEHERVPYENEYVGELKKQLEEKENIACNWKYSCLENAGKIEKLENQQKEFIKYLEDEIKRLKENDIYEPLQRMTLATHQHNLSKYKEIIGDIDDKR